MSKSAKMEVFQELRLRGPESRRGELRDALIQHATAPWSHAADRERSSSQVANFHEREVTLFERSSGGEGEAVGLVLGSLPDGFEVTNIVPIEGDELEPHRYNAALQDFVARVAKPAATAAGFTVEMTAAEEGLDDWLPIDVADALRQFSAAANKSTGSSHPSDRKRWCAFLIAVHRNRGNLDADRLVHWLTEVEGWEDSEAHNLAIEYEFGMALLAEYDR